MKKIFLPFLLTALTITSALADVNGRIDIIIPVNDHQCRERLDQTRREADNLSIQLNRCLTDSRRGGRRNDRIEDRLAEANKEIQDLRLRNSNLISQIDILQGQNDRLRNLNDNLSMQNERLKIDIARLEDELRPNRGGFDLADSIRACGLIENAVYAKNCASDARESSISATVIRECAQLKNTFYAADCVKKAGRNNANAQQVKACVKIQNDVYATNCVASAGEKRLSHDVISACVQSSNNAFYQAQCVIDM